MYTLLPTSDAYHSYFVQRCESCIKQSVVLVDCYLYVVLFRIFKLWPKCFVFLLEGQEYQMFVCVLNIGDQIYNIII